MREVDEPVAGEQGLLLAERVAVVRRDSGVDALGLNGAGQVEQGLAYVVTRWLRVVGSGGLVRSGDSLAQCRRP